MSFYGMALYGWCLSLIFIGTAGAQLSPGDLHRAHAEFEHIKNCTKCHDAGHGVNAKRCLDCHRFLQQRIQAGKGLHAQPDYQACETCHVDHQGRNGELIIWKGGKDKFDHELTGYALVGKHANLRCEKCHLPEFIVDTKPLLDEKIDLKKTLLGLNQDCLTCHVDEHRGGLNPSCLNCHTMEGWKPASKFDHNRTVYPLTGKHIQVACTKCHPLVTDHKYKTDADFSRYKGLAFQRCRDCHQDVHQGRLGIVCETCHTVDSWAKVPDAIFDHAKTRYPLIGKHRAVPCAKCHFPGKSIRGLAFALCSDCHRDEHQGQFVQREGHGACEACHDVESFSPAKYGVKDHKKSKYPLQGAHLAVACLQCHKKTYGAGSTLTFQFVFPDQSCTVCHTDVHQGEVNNFLPGRGCENCHTVDDWHGIDFDHNRTKYKLDGRHATTPCVGCHKIILTDTPQTRIQFKGLSQKCQDCHEDVHQGQFLQQYQDGSLSSEPQACSYCHGGDKWQPSHFDHNRDSQFKLEGAHKKLICSACHKKEIRNGRPMIRYMPLGKACKECHDKISVMPR